MATLAATAAATLLASGGVTVEAPWGVCTDSIVERFVWCDSPTGERSRAASVPEEVLGGVRWTTATMGPGTVTVRAVQPGELAGKPLVYRSDGGATVRREGSVLVLTLPHFNRPERPFDTTEIRVRLPWDLDGDGRVDGSDLSIVLGSWGKPYGGSDLAEILSAWGSAVGDGAWSPVG
jgi:hypothetical protein